MTTFGEAAARGYDLLITLYQKEDFTGNFWFAGNSLHACLNYLIAANRKDGCGILTVGYKKYVDLLPNPNWWHDDFAWWGNAFAFAIQNRNELGCNGSEHDALFKNLSTAAQDCFKKLLSSWSTDPYSKERDHAAGSADIRGGTFNLQSAETMSGRNSVTNEGFWILSQRLAKLDTKNPDYSKYAGAEANWFGDWQKLPKTPERKNGILRFDGLVLERPLGNGTYPGWCWTGDQGLFMEGLSFNSAAENIANAAVQRMTDGQGVLHEDLNFDTTDYLHDYATGKGIAMRSFGLTNRYSPFRPFSKFINTNGAAVWSNRVQQAGNQYDVNQFTFNWNPPGIPKQPPKEPQFLLPTKTKPAGLCKVIMQTAGLEALAANLWVYSQAPIVWPPVADA